MTAISSISALILGFTYTMTKDVIAQVKLEKMLRAIKDVLPDFDNDPAAEKYSLPGFEELEFYPAKKGDAWVGTAVKTFSDKGFGSEDISLMVGINSELKVHRISVLNHRETPGLGTKMDTAKFKDQFQDKTLQTFQFKVKKDGGDVDGITAATISSRAFCEATEKALRALQQGGRK